MGEDIELSIEETNKLRAQLGLPLIPIPGKEEPRQSDHKKLNPKQTNTLRASLGLRPIAHEGSLPEKRLNLDDSAAAQEPDEGSFFYNQVDANLWLENVGKPRAKNNPDNTDAESTVGVEAELELKHDSKTLSSLKDGEVLTLQDQGLLDDSNDVLFNDGLAKMEKLKKDDQERAKTRRILFGLKIDYDLEPEDIDNMGPILIKSSTIRLPGQSEKPEVEHTAKSVLLFDSNETELTIAPIKMKKIKAKKSQTKRKTASDIIVPQKMTTDTLDSIEDDDPVGELEALFDASRQRKLKQRKLMSAEEMAHELKVHLRIDATEEIEGIVYDNTQDFLDVLPVSSLDKETMKGDEHSEEAEAPASQPQAPASQPQVPASQPQVPASQPQAPASQARENALHVASEGTEKEDVSKVSEQIEEDETEAPKVSTEESNQKPEPTLNTLLDTLRYLRQTNGLQDLNDRQKSAEKQYRLAQKEAQLAKLQIKIEERVVREELERDAQYAKLSPEEKNNSIDRILNERLVQKGIVTDVKSRGRYSDYATTDRLAEYNPQVKVSYKDERGNLLDKKQAWKQLLHRYHGLAPKNKKEISRVKTDQEARDIHPGNS